MLAQARPSMINSLQKVTVVPATAWFVQIKLWCSPGTKGHVGLNWELGGEGILSTSYEPVVAAQCGELNYL